MANPNIDDTTPLAQYLIFSTTGISFLACLWLLWNVWRMENRNYSIRMIRWIGGIDLVQDVAQIAYEILQYKKDKSVASDYIQIIVYASNASSLMWSSALALLSYKIITMSKVFDQERFYSYCKCYIVPVNIVLGIAYGILHHADEKDPVGTGVWYLKYFLISPQFIVAIFLPIVCYCRYYYKVKTSYKPEFLKMNKIKIGKLMMYPLTLALIYGPATFADYFVATIPTWIYNFIQFIYPLNGLVNAILYLYVRNIKVDAPYRKDDGQVGISMNNEVSRKAKIETGEPNRSQSDLDDSNILQRALMD